MAKNIVAGLDIGTAAVRLVVGEVASETGRMRVLAQIKKNSSGLRRGYVVNYEETTTAVREVLVEAERQLKFRVKSVYLAIGGITLEAKESLGQIAVAKADLEITDTDVKRVVEVSEANLTDFANRRVIHTIPLGFKLDGKKILGRPEGLKGNKLEVRTLFINCLNQHLEDLIQVVESAGLIVEDIVAAPVAASLPVLTPPQKAAGCVLANIGSQTTSIIVYEDGTPISLQVFPLGSNDVTNDIALGLRISLDEAEKMKLEGSGSTVNIQRKLDEIIEARLSDMFELIENHLKKLGRDGLLPAGIIIVGGGAHVDDIEKLAKTTLRLPAKIFDPSTEPYLKSQLRDSPWAVAYGLCLSGLGNGPGERPRGPGLTELLRRAVRSTKAFWP
ncbi:MAG: cell division protein FtsA [Candidatus Vogelbacteria bacterium]|nr:cell division protein FtsA [Candidatus Vogelbacteria bacterium]